MRKLLLILFWITTSIVLGQKKTDINRSQPLFEVIKQIERTFQIKINYRADLIKDINVSIDLKNKSLDEIIASLQDLTELNFVKLNRRFYFIKKPVSQLLNDVFLFTYLIKGIDFKKDGSFQLTPQKTSLLPGQTEPDILKSLQKIPGVYGIDGTAADLNVRGGKSDYNKILWNYTPVYHRGYLFGLISPFNPYIISQVNFYYQGTTARLGEAVSSIIDIHSNHKIAEKGHAELGINGLHGDLLIRLPLVKNKIDVEFATRHSYANWIETTSMENYQEKAFYGTRFSSKKFNFNDYSFGLQYKFNPKNKLNFYYLHIDNVLSDKISLSNTKEDHISDAQSDAYSLVWKKTGNWQQNILWSFSNYKYDYQIHEKDMQDNFVSKTLKRNYINDLQLKANFSKYFDKHRLTLGYQAVYQRVQYHFIKDKSIIYFLKDSDHSQLNHIFYIEDQWHLGKSNLRLGLRNVLRPFQNRYIFEPRMLFNRPLNKHWAWQLSLEKKHQDIYVIKETLNSNFLLYNNLWNLADGEHLPSISSWHGSSGLSFHKNNWLLDVNLYYKYIDNIYTLTLGYFNNKQQYFLLGNQHTFGINLFIKKKWKRWNLWGSYAYMDSKTHHNNINNGKPFTSSLEIKHLLNLSLIYSYHKFRFGLSWLYHTGAPYSKIVDDELIENAINTLHLPDYHQLDFSFTYQFKCDPTSKTHFKTGLSFTNIFNNLTPIGINIFGKNTVDEHVRYQYIYPIRFTPNFIFRAYIN